MRLHGSHMFVALSVTRARGCSQASLPHCTPASSIQSWAQSFRLVRATLPVLTGPIGMQTRCPAIPAFGRMQYPRRFRGPTTLSAERPTGSYSPAPSSPSGPPMLTTLLSTRFRGPIS
ncbi:hypothetical protein J3E69DRAFT_335188 [Trichoderma sp. SZMC 28015]